MKKIIAITTTILLVICFSTVSAHADRKTMEGFILGTGAVLLGTALYKGFHNDSNIQYPPQRTGHYKYSYNRDNHNDRYDYKQNHRKKNNLHNRRSHWKIKKVWIDPIYETRWNPGHYNHKGQWISGRKIDILVQEGYWKKKRILVRR
jgi:hypothetical protein